MKLQDVITKAIASVQSEVNSGVADAVAKAPATKAPKSTGVISGKTKAFTGNYEAEKILETALIAKMIKGQLPGVTSNQVNGKLKAVGVTGDVAELLPDGFTGAMIRDVELELNVAKLFPMGQVPGGVAHDLIMLNGIRTYLTAEGADATQSSETQMTFVKTTKKVMAEVAKSYEVVDDALIDLAAEVRYGMARAIAEAIEGIVVNGDIAGTLDDATNLAANYPVTVANGLRKHALVKGTVDFTGAALTEDEMFAKIQEMSLAGGKYLSRSEINKGNVALIVDDYMYNHVAGYNSFKTLEKAGNVATVFGGKVDSVFNIPIIVTTSLPSVNATGVVDAVGGNNTLSTCVMVNVEAYKLFANGTVTAETEMYKRNQTISWFTSLRFGFAGIYDSTEAALNTPNATYKTAIAGINIAR